MSRAFAAACKRLYQLAKEQPRLKDMGTTLTAVNLLDDRMVVGHVGDTRCYLLRGGRLRQLTEDHAVRRSEHQLVRCVGAGREHEDVDVMTHPLSPGDVVVLMTDGLWDSVEPDVIQQVLQRDAAQRAAQELVRLAVEAGGTDNSTAVVVHVRQCGDPATRALVAIEPPVRELARLPRMDGAVPRLGRPMWPWVVLTVAFAALGLAAARFAFGFDPFAGR